VARDLEAEGAPIVGNSRISTISPKDRGGFSSLLQRLRLMKHAAQSEARNESDALRLARRSVYPLVGRPSDVLGGARWRSWHEPRDWTLHGEAVKVSKIAEPADRSWTTRSRSTATESRTAAGADRRRDARHIERRRARGDSAAAAAVLAAVQHYFFPRS